MAKEILWAGVSRFNESVRLEAIKDSLPDLNPHFCRSVLSSLDLLGSRHIDGVFIGDLWLPLCEIEQVRRKEEILGVLNSTESSERFGGELYLARYSVRQGIPVLAYAFMD
jgi:hypothetical protein